MKLKNTRRGFTLIELLVVVLIIGILAAVAVPQYKVAVMKGRIAQVIPYLKAVKDAEEVYFLANGTYTDDMKKLDVDFGAAPDGWTYELMRDGTLFVSAYRTNWGKEMVIAYSFSGRGVLKDKLYCSANKKEQKAYNICKSYGVEVFSNDDVASFEIGS